MLEGSFSLAAPSDVSSSDVARAVVAGAISSTLPQYFLAQCVLDINIQFDKLENPADKNEIRKAWKQLGMPGNSFKQDLDGYQKFVQLLKGEEVDFNGEKLHLSKNIWDDPGIVQKTPAGSLGNTFWTMYNFAKFIQEKIDERISLPNIVFPFSIPDDVKSVLTSSYPKIKPSCIQTKPCGTPNIGVICLNGEEFKGEKSMLSSGESLISDAEALKNYFKEIPGTGIIEGFLFNNNFDLFSKLDNKFTLTLSACALPYLSDKNKREKLFAIILKHVPQLVGNLEEYAALLWDEIYQVFGSREGFEKPKNIVDYIQNNFDEVIGHIDWNKKPELRTEYDLVRESDKKDWIQKNAETIKDLVLWDEIFISENPNPKFLQKKILENEDFRDHIKEQILKFSQDHGITSLVTCGQFGSVLYTPDGLKTECTSNSTLEILSTKGAGDNFFAGYFIGESLGLEKLKCMQLGTMFAEACITNGQATLNEEIFSEIFGKRPIPGTDLSTFILNKINACFPTITKSKDLQKQDGLQR